MTSSSKLWWIAGPVAAAIALALGWVLLVSPKQAEAAELSEQAQAQEAQNVQAQLQIKTLQSQSKTLPAQKAELAKLRTQIPASEDLASLIRALSAAAVASGVELTEVTPQSPSPAVGAAAPTSAGAAPVSAGGLQKIPVVIGVKGTYYAAERFLTSLETMRRALLVTSVDTTRDEAKGSAKLVLSINASAFMSEPVTTTATTSGAGAPASGTAN